MIEAFIRWFSESDFIIHASLRNTLTYVNYSGAMAGMAVIAVLIEMIKNATKEQKMGLSNSFLVGLVLTFSFGVALKPTLDGIAFFVKKVDKQTKLSPEEKEAMSFVALSQKKAELSTDIEELKKMNGGKWSTDLILKQAHIWAADLQMASKLNNVVTGSSGLSMFSPERMIEMIVGGFRGLIKIYYISMMNILYGLLPLAYVFSVFKPGHYLKALGMYVLFGFAIIIVNFMEWVVFTIFLDQTINEASLGSMIFSTGAVLYQILALFIYIRAMFFARMVLPIKGEDIIGPMAGQALAGATFLAMKALKIPGAGSNPFKQQSGSGGSEGPLEITTGKK